MMIAACVVVSLRPTTWRRSLDLWQRRESRATERQARPGAPRQVLACRPSALPAAVHAAATSAAPQRLLAAKRLLPSSPPRAPAAARRRLPGRRPSLAPATTTSGETSTASGSRHASSRIRVHAQAPVTWSAGVPAASRRRTRRHARSRARAGALRARRRGRARRARSPRPRRARSTGTCAPNRSGSGGLHASRRVRGCGRRSVCGFGLVAGRSSSRAESSSKPCASGSVQAGLIPGYSSPCAISAGCSRVLLRLQQYGSGCGRAGEQRQENERDASPRRCSPVAPRPFDPAERERRAHRGRDDHDPNLAGCTENERPDHHAGDAGEKERGPARVCEDDGDHRPPGREGVERAAGPLAVPVQMFASSAQPRTRAPTRTIAIPDSRRAARSDASNAAPATPGSTNRPIAHVVTAPAYVTAATRHVTVDRELLSASHCAATRSSAPSTSSTRRPCSGSCRPRRDTDDRQRGRDRRDRPHRPHARAARACP